ncbi:MAG: N-acetylmuramoyl-L-alanine amidase [Asticcacaulis sp.]
MIRQFCRFVGIGRFKAAGKVWAGALMAATISVAVAEVPTVAAADKADTVKVRLGGTQSQTRLVIDLDSSVRGELLSRDTDYSQAVLGLSGGGIPKGQSGEGRGLIRSWKLESMAGITRLKIEFNGEARISRRFLLPPGDGVGHYRYVIDVVPKNGVTPQVVQAAVVPTPKPRAAAVPVVDKRNAKKIIVIDAGHGGKDPGARGSFSWEKDVNLAAAKTLKKKLEATGRYRVIMTRETDAYVDKVARVRIARNANADLFISLHSDASASPGTRGASVYTLSDSGTERAARNAMNAGDWSLPKASDDKMVNRILVDLTQRATKNRSATFAELMLGKLEGTTPLVKSSHRQAGFVVLLAADVPAILFEMGFMSNVEDEKLLNDSGYQSRMMGQVTKAIDQYFANDVAYASFALIP